MLVISALLISVIAMVVYGVGLVRQRAPALCGLVPGGSKGFPVSATLGDPLYPARVLNTVLSGIAVSR